MASSGTPAFLVPGPFPPAPVPWGGVWRCRRSPGPHPRSPASGPTPSQARWVASRRPAPPLPTWLPGVCGQQMGPPRSTANEQLSSLLHYASRASCAPALSGRPGGSLAAWLAVALGGAGVSPGVGGLGTPWDFHRQAQLQLLVSRRGHGPRLRLPRGSPVAKPLPRTNRECVQRAGGGSGHGGRSRQRFWALGTLAVPRHVPPGDGASLAILAHCGAALWVATRPLWASCASLGTGVTMPHSLIRGTWFKPGI